MILTESLSSIVFNLAVQKSDGSFVQSGTGVVVRYNSNYYLLTAKHCLMFGATQLNKQVPTFQNSGIQVAMLDDKINLIHKEELVDLNAGTVRFIVHKISTHEALDVAVLKLLEPSALVKSRSLDSSSIAESNEIDYLDTLVCAGFLADEDRKMCEVRSRYLPDSIQVLLEEESINYFMMEREIDMKGMSGTVVCSNKTHKVVGILAGQNKDHPIAYVIHSKYIWKCLRDAELIINRL